MAGKPRVKIWEISSLVNIWENYGNNQLKITHVLPYSNELLNIFLDGPGDRGACSLVFVLGWFRNIVICWSWHRLAYISSLFG